MTLIQTCITPFSVTMVADRRLTRGSSVVDDDATKLVALCNKAAIAYSGFARLPDGRRMDEWILRVLLDHRATQLVEAAEIIRDEATRAFTPLPYSPRDSRLAIVLGGWDTAADGRLLPLMGVISNSLDQQLKWLSTARRSFEFHQSWLATPNQFILHELGATVPGPVKYPLVRALLRGFPKGIREWSVLRLLVRSARAVSDLDSSVGPWLLTVNIPNPNQSWPTGIMSGPPSLGAMTFVDFNYPSERGTRASPHFACRGFGYQNIKVSYGPNA